MTKLITITWSDSDDYNIKDTFLYRSFIKNNPIQYFVHIHYNRNNYKDLEQIFSSNYGFQYESILYKIFLTKEKLQNIEADYLIFADANDVVCLGDINTLPSPDKILVSSEINQYPSSMGDWGGLEYSDNERSNKHFLNSGLFMASKENYINLLSNITNNVLNNHLKSFGGDQGAFIYHYLSKHQPEIVLDKEYKVFFNTYNRHHEDYIGYNFPMFVHDNGWNWGSPRFIEKFNLI